LMICVVRSTVFSVRGDSSPFDSIGIYLRTARSHLTVYLLRTENTVFFLYRPDNLKESNRTTSNICYTCSFVYHINRDTSDNMTDVPVCFRNANHWYIFASTGDQQIHNWYISGRKRVIVTLLNVLCASDLNNKESVALCKSNALKHITLVRML
jgi:hypothetical protein